jgi:hypothetical protein
MSGDLKPLEFKSEGCAEFQQQLPELFSSADVIEHPHLRTCRNCSSLVRDLEYIAQQAKDLITPVEPSESVWENIHLAIQREAESTGTHTPAKR